MESKRAHFLLTSILALILLGLMGFVLVTGYAGYMSGESQTAAAPRTEFLGSGQPSPARAFSVRDVPRVLYVHVAIIAALQVLAIMMAARRARGGCATKGELLTIQFLCEIPMYLGLFGTLLGVCLTQFMSGSLVAPLAYLTTMSGILLHLVGKLLVWLPLSAAEQGDE